jgi:hypothetical protein
MLPKYLFGKARNTLEGENKAPGAVCECPGCKMRATEAELERRWAVQALRRAHALAARMASR